MHNSTMVCGLYNIKDIEEISLNIKNRIHELSYSQIDELKNQYRFNKSNTIDIDLKIDKLQTYLKILTRLKDNVFSGCEICFTRKDLQCLVEKIKNILGKNCRSRYCDIIINNEREEEWVVKKPYCRSYQEWEKWSKYFCEKLDIELTIERTKNPDLILEIFTEVIKPNVLLALSAYKVVKDNLNLEISRSSSETKLDFELLVEKVPHIDLTLDVYQKLVTQHRLSFDIIKTVYDSGLSLQINSKGVGIKTPMNVYNLAEISGKINTKYLEKFGIKPDTNQKDYLQDYK